MTNDAWRFMKKERENIDEAKVKKLKGLESKREICYQELNISLKIRDKNIKQSVKQVLWRFISAKWIKLYWRREIY